MVHILDEMLEIEELVIPGYEKVLKVTNTPAGLQAIICIHSTVMGPALGGTRIYPYPTFEAALNDVMRLSQGMTYKSALSETGWGGGKSVIIADSKKDKTPELLSAFAEAVDRLQGEYICAEDVGCSPQDLLLIGSITPFAVGLPQEQLSGNPAPYTAWGTFRGIQSVFKKLYGSDSVEGRLVAIQGLGNVGYELAQFLFWAGARLIVSDIDSQKCQRVASQTGAKIVSPEQILTVECDVFAPCAMGGILNSQTIPLLRCRAVAGSANNQLLKDSDADELAARGIFYAPDFVINAGGLINVSQELASGGYNPSMARNKVNKIYDQLMVIYDIAEQNRCSTHKAALSLADYRIKYKIGKRVEPPAFRTRSSLKS